MKKLLFLILLLSGGLHGQLGVNEIPARDRAIADGQARQIFKALEGARFEVCEFVFPIYSGRELLAYGISLGEGKLLTKASEVVMARDVFTLHRDGHALVARVSGIYPEEDLAVIKVPGLEAAAVEWADAESLAEGAILAAVREDGEAQAMGVLSVKERSLRTGDQGFLGIRMDPSAAGNGVRIKAVVNGSAAAAVGMRAGDVITMIDGGEVGGFYELSNRLRRMTKGQQPEIELLRSQRSVKVAPVLRGREIDAPESRRLRRMDQMSGSQSRVRGGFGSVIQSDMVLESYHAGLPVVDLEGRVVGIVIARAGRISTLILPGAEIAEILREEARPLERRSYSGMGGRRTHAEAGMPHFLRRLRR